MSYQLTYETMTHGTQKIIAEKAGISEGFLSEILAAKKRPSWQSAKKLAEATSTDPVLWLEGSSDEIKAAISKKESSESCQNQEVAA